MKPEDQSKMTKPQQPGQPGQPGGYDKSKQQQPGAGKPNVGNQGQAGAPYNKPGAGAGQQRPGAQQNPGQKKDDFNRN
ncbi:MAG: hypothetical protein SFW66_01875 [Gammaproteobacteria bacterium]|nr:hypothetical protein [Gammaproteobacteria bacterium]